MEVVLAKKPCKVILRFEEMPETMDVATFTGMAQYVQRVMKNVGAGMHTDMSAPTKQKYTKYDPEVFKKYMAASKGKTRAERLLIGQKMGLPFVDIEHVTRYETYGKLKFSNN